MLKSDQPDQPDISLSQLAQYLGLQFQGDANQIITAVASLTSANSSELCFLQSPTYLGKLQASNCGVVIVPLDFSDNISGKSILYARNPYLAFVKAIHILHPQPENIESAEIHASSQVAESAQLGENISIGANSVIGQGVKIADNVSIGPGCIVEQDCEIGAYSRLLSGVTLCHDVSIGEHVILHPGVVIGSDGFGLVYDESNWIKIPHMGGVQIGDRVEIGANTTVDRGALDDTVIENGVKLDNLIQVAHNVHIGENSAIAACVGIAGSAIIGKNCKISGAAVVLGHLTIADNVTVTAMSLVTKSIIQSGTYSSGTPLMENRQWNRNNARYKTLDKLARTVSSLDKKK